MSEKRFVIHDSSVEEYVESLCAVVKNTEICAGAMSNFARMQKEMNTWSTLKDKLKQDQVLTLQMSEKFRQKCSQLEVNEILSPFTKFTVRSDRKIC